jgi:hypothetical protein
MSKQLKSYAEAVFAKDDFPKPKGKDKARPILFQDQKIADQLCKNIVRI